MKQFLIGLATATLLVVPVLVLAQTTVQPSPGTTVQPQQVTPNGQGQSVTVQNPLGNVNSFCGLIKALLGAAIQIGIPIAVLFIVYAGFKFVLARGNAEALTQARQNMLYTVIGIAIFLGAWLLAQVIANTINTIGQGANGNAALISCQ